MKRVDRNKILVRHIVSLGLAASQKDGPPVTDLERGRFLFLLPVSKKVFVSGHAIVGQKKRKPFRRFPTFMNREAAFSVEERIPIGCWEMWTEMVSWMLPTT
jgi:hypothetical protein